ncbi:uncharacterized protein LOC118432939 [Folsomia candida]|uniref:uncharacterized protein LOC118432939 n=1 Tax=Folsomia candida TaxID=158441 RepID=UPI001604A1C9|nr:uncharacterized protein LOC118432939 [Folsomia candida]
MKLRSSSSRQGERSVPNFSFLCWESLVRLVPAPKKVRVAADNAMSKVLRNPLILDAIFAKLGLPDLKTSRLVCHDWDDVAATELGKRTLFHLNEFFACKASGAPPVLRDFDIRILDSIFANLSIPDLHTSRLVCHDWNDVASTFLGKQAPFHINELPACKASQYPGVPPVNDKLLRRLLISLDFHPSFGLVKWKAEVLTKALTQLTQLSQLTRELKFVITTKDYVSVFIEAFRILGSTKIQQICIFNQVTKIPAQAYQPLPTQHDLTSLKFKIMPEIRHYNAIGCPSYIQIWIDAAPNLTSLDFRGCFYPNLEGCKNLTVLKFSYFTNYADRGSLNLCKVTKMLGQVKDSLVELELSHNIAICASKEPVKIIRYLLVKIVCAWKKSGRVS